METQNIDHSFQEFCWDELRGPDELSKTIMLFFSLYSLCLSRHDHWSISYQSEFWDKHKALQGALAALQ